MELFQILGDYYWRENFEINNQNLIDFAYELQDKSEGREVSNKGGFQTECPPWIENSHELHNKIIDTANQQIKRDLELRDDVEFYMLELWCNINPPGAENIPHTHTVFEYNRVTPLSIISGTYYAKLPKGSGSIVFTKQNNNEIIVPNQFIKNKNNKFYAKAHQIQTVEQECVFWFSDLQHFVEKNTSEHDRISYSFNLGLNYR